MNHAAHDITRFSGRQPLAIATAALLALLVAACVFVPGRFTSQLDLRADRTFSFRYTGEIVMVPLMKAEKPATFAPEPCHDAETYEERACTPDEVAQQEQEWQATREAKRKSDAQAAQLLLGGIDPENPAAGHELAAKLRRQTGWNRVEYIGKGKFDVDYTATGRLDHDFTFPTMEGFSMANAFVQIVLRKDGSVRIDAPGYGPAGGGSAMAGMMAGMPGGESDQEGVTALADGTFTLTTNGQVLANNTDEGPQPSPSGQSLSWQINPRTQVAPTALVKLAQ